MRIAFSICCVFWGSLVILLYGLHAHSYLVVLFFGIAILQAILALSCSRAGGRRG
jgi:hypothetical protein